MFEVEMGRTLRRWDVLRLQAGRASEMVLLSPKFFALTTHYTDRTIPCSGLECPLCEIIPRRGLFYVAGSVNGRIVMVEMSAVAANHLETHAKLLNGGMQPGQVYVLKRSGAKQPIHSECVRLQDGVTAISHFDLCKHVMAVFRFPCPNPDETIEDYERRCHRLAFVRNKRAAELILSGRKTGV